MRLRVVLVRDESNNMIYWSACVAYYTEAEERRLDHLAIVGL
jgi:hypothetical protein